MKQSNSWTDSASSSAGQRAERRPAPDLAAFHPSGSGMKQERVKDISATGVYLVTSERWLPGEVISLTLQRKGPPEKSPDRRITLKTMAVRWGEDGVALSFVLPRGLDVRLWESPLKNNADTTEPEDILREFRLAKVLAFLSRISPAAGEEVRQLLREGLSNYRVESVCEIVCKAESMLSSNPNGDRLLANPRLVVRILEAGSWAADQVATQQLWAGLLASSCTPDGKDESNLAFVDLLSQLAAMHILIFTAACSRATKAQSSLGRIASKNIGCTTQEIMQLTGWRDLIRIERDIEHLYDLGLLQKRVKSAFFVSNDDARISPSSLGLQMFARCSGYRGDAHSFYEADSPAETILANEL
jgi:hypothetical protein